jgi:flagellar hook-basal body complex protein FliE
MKVSHIPVNLLDSLKLERPKQAVTAQDFTQRFGAFLETALERTNGAQVSADEMGQKFMEGKDVPVHRVMMELTKADITMKLASAVTKKVINAYQEIARINV